MELWNKGTLSLVWFRTMCHPADLVTCEPFLRALIVFVHGVSQRITPAGTCWQLASPQRCFHLLTDSACVVLRLLAGWAGAPSLSLCSVPAVLIITRSKSRTLSYLHSGTTQMFPRCVFLSLLLLLFCCQPESGSDVVLFTERWQL